VIITTPFALLLLLALPLAWAIERPAGRQRWRREAASLALRTVLLALVVLALAGLAITQPARKVAVVFLVDHSDSVGSQNRETQRVLIGQALRSKPPEDTWGMVVFAENAAVEQQLTARDEVRAVGSLVETGDTNLAAAINTAFGMFPADSTPRIVILSDGVETQGSAIQAAERARAAGIEISHIPLERPTLPDTRVSGLGMPARVAQGQPFDVGLTVESDRPQQARLLLFLNGELLQEQSLSLEAGVNRYTFSQQINEPGFLNYTAELIVAEDAYSQNNRLSAFSQVVGQPRVLLLAESEEEVQFVRPAMEAAGYEVITLAPQRLPADTTALAGYRAVVLANVPAARFSQRQMERIASAVRDLGVGLLVIGGDSSFGPGGYADTPLEAVLPVESRIRDEERIPQLTIAYLIDSSGSMENSDDGIYSYLQLSQQAIIASLEMLQPSDRAAIGTFDSDGQWVARFQNVEDRRALQSLVAALRAGGGTDIRAGLGLVERDIAAETSPLKHLILLTDGGADTRSLVETAERLHQQYGVTISTIGIGPRPPPFLERMAEVAQGRYYAITDASQIPNIFAQDTVLATRSYVVEGAVEPVYSAVSPIMSGIGQPPSLNGYIATTPRQTAQVVLNAGQPYNDPLLAQWQVGLGRAAAFTSDGGSRWGGNWLEWADFGRFWGQTVSWVITEVSSTGLEITITEQGETARITLDARSADGELVNGAAFTGSLLSPTNTSVPLVFRQTNAGEYTAVFHPDDDGAYFVAIAGQAGDVPYTAREGWVKGYSQEYIQPQTAPTLLADIAAVTGGQNLAPNPAAAFAAPRTPRMAIVSLAPWLLLLAALLLPLDIALRRVIITRSDLQRLRGWLRPARAAATSERMASLISAKQRTREAAPTPADLPITLPSPTIPQPTGVPAPRPTSGDGSTVGALLKKRREDTEKIR
jgi:uncharacterized membrane protein